jgi:tRNA 2-selenouridine synthase
LAPIGLLLAQVVSAVVRSLIFSIELVGKPCNSEGGYQGFRRVVIDGLDESAKQFSFQVICGMTGSGKTRVLQEAARYGAQIVDLEALAIHRGSVLGNEPNIEQPTQKGFETALWNALRTLDPSKPMSG